MDTDTPVLCTYTNFIHHKQALTPFDININLNWINVFSFEAGLLEQVSASLFLHKKKQKVKSKLQTTSLIFVT